MCFFSKILVKCRGKEVLLDWQVDWKKKAFLFGALLPGQQMWRGLVKQGGFVFFFFLSSRPMPFFFFNVSLVQLIHSSFDERGEHKKKKTVCFNSGSLWSSSRPFPTRFFFSSFTATTISLVDTNTFFFFYRDILLTPSTLKAPPIFWRSTSREEVKSHRHHLHYTFVFEWFALRKWQAGLLFFPISKQLTSSADAPSLTIFNSSVRNARRLSDWRLFL